MPEQPAALTGQTHEVDFENLPPLMRDGSFVGAGVTQFLGAFNDNVFKQLMLLLAIQTNGEGGDQQGKAMIVFASAFLLFSGLAGYVADKVSKRTVIVSSKVGEIVIMLLGLVGFYCYDLIGFNGMLLVLFLMGVQSAYFGPSKYGILPEMVRTEDLPRANGVFLMLTFLAIIFGQVLAGALKDFFGDENVWKASIACVSIAVVGTITSLWIRRVPVAAPDLRFDWRMAGVSREMLALLRRDRPLLAALLVATMFWMVGGIVQQAVNALGKAQLKLSDTQTSYMAGSVGLGIAAGCICGGFLSSGKINTRVVVVGSAGIFTNMILLALPGSNNGHLLGYAGSIPVLILLGFFTGVFIVPIQVALQSWPPKEEKGRMLAMMNQCTWVGIVLSGVIYDLCIKFLGPDGPRAPIFFVTAVIMLPVAIFYRPSDEAHKREAQPGAA